VKGTDWTAFGGIRQRALALMAKGKKNQTWSVPDVYFALKTRDAGTRKVLRELAAEGKVVESFERRGRHAVVCYRLAN
jgi:hypothetical protein